MGRNGEEMDEECVHFDEAVEEAEEEEQAWMKPVAAEGGGGKRKANLYDIASVASRSLAKFKKQRCMPHDLANAEPAFQMPNANFANMPPNTGVHLGLPPTSSTWEKKPATPNLNWILMSSSDAAAPPSSYPISSSRGGVLPLLSLAASTDSESFRTPLEAPGSPDLCMKGENTLPKSRRIQMKPGFYKDLDETEPEKRRRGRPKNGTKSYKHSKFRVSLK